MRELVARPEAARTQNHATPNHGIIVFTVSLFIYPGVQRWATRASWQFLFPAFKAMRTGCCSPPPHFDISEKVPRPPGAAPPLPPLVDFRPSVRPSVQFRSSSSSPRWPFHSWRSSSHFAVTTSEFHPSSSKCLSFGSTKVDISVSESESLRSAFSLSFFGHEGILFALCCGAMVAPVRDFSS